MLDRAVIEICGCFGATLVVGYLLFCLAGFVWLLLHLTGILA